jgi:dGTPase
MSNPPCSIYLSLAGVKELSVSRKPTNSAAAGARLDGHDAYGAGLAPGARSPASYAASAVASRGRCHNEAACPTRSPFQRDRDRILHASAFRRLTYKTQVFLFHEGDHYRTRLTHSLEVAQIARTVSRQLQLDEDLAEALSLAHDLGHSPFGHAGERALDAATRAHGGFDHNAQSFRVVTALERKYAAFDGLNLTWEMLEGLVKHNGPLPPDPMGAVRRAVRVLEGWQSLDLATWPSAEAQVAALADDIAYSTHDLDDGLRAGLLTLEDLRTAPLVGPLVAQVAALATQADRAQRIYEVIRRLITVLVADLVNESRRRFAFLAPTTPDDIRAAAGPTVAFSAATAAGLVALKAFLFARVYRHPKVMHVMDGAEAVVGDLFRHFLAHPQDLPPSWSGSLVGRNERQRARLVADFVAGMTDRYAIAEHRRLFDATPELR